MSILLEVCVLRQLLEGQIPEEQRTFPLEEFNEVVYKVVKKTVVSYAEFVKESYAGSHCPDYMSEIWELLSYTGDVVRIEQRGSGGEWFPLAHGKFIATPGSDTVQVLDKNSNLLKKHICTGEEIASGKKRVVVVVKV